jgi:hypothetical protein
MADNNDIVSRKDLTLTKELAIKYGVAMPSVARPENAEFTLGYTWNGENYQVKPNEGHAWLTDYEHDYRLRNPDGTVRNPNTELFTMDRFPLTPADPAAAGPAAVDDGIDCAKIHTKFTRLKQEFEEANTTLIEFKADKKVPSRWETIVKWGGDAKNLLGLKPTDERLKVFNEYKNYWDKAKKASDELADYDNWINRKPKVKNKCFYQRSTSMGENKVSQKIRSLIKEEIRKLFDPI